MNEVVVVNRESRVSDISARDLSCMKLRHVLLSDDDVKAAPLEPPDHCRIII